MRWWRMQLAAGCCSRWRCHCRCRCRRRVIAICATRRMINEISKHLSTAAARQLPQEAKEESEKLFVSRVKLAWSFLFFLATNADRRGLRGKGRHGGSIIIIIIGTAIFEVLSESVGRLSKCFLCALPDFRCNPIAAKERGGEGSVLTQSDYLIKPIMLQHTPTHTTEHNREKNNRNRELLHLWVFMQRIMAASHSKRSCAQFSVPATEASTIFQELSPNLIAHCCFQRNLRNTCQSMQQCYIGSGSSCNVQLATNWREREREFCRAW